MVTIMNKVIDVGLAALVGACAGPMSNGERHTVRVSVELDGTEVAARSLGYSQSGSCRTERSLRTNPNDPNDVYSVVRVTCDEDNDNTWDFRTYTARGRGQTLPYRVEMRLPGENGKRSSSRCSVLQYNGVGQDREVNRSRVVDCSSLEQ